MSAVVIAEVCRVVTVRLVRREGFVPIRHGVIVVPPSPRIEVVTIRVGRPILRVGRRCGRKKAEGNGTNQHHLFHGISTFSVLPTDIPLPLTLPSPPPSPRLRRAGAGRGCAKEYPWGWMNMKERIESLTEFFTVLQCRSTAPHSRVRRIRTASANAPCSTVPAALYPDSTQYLAIDEVFLPPVLEAGKLPIGFCGLLVFGVRLIEPWANGFERKWAGGLATDAEL